VPDTGDSQRGAVRRLIERLVDESARFAANRRQSGRGSVKFQLAKALIADSQRPDGGPGPWCWRPRAPTSPARTADRAVLREVLRREALSRVGRPGGADPGGAGYMRGTGSRALPGFRLFRLYAGTSRSATDHRRQVLSADGFTHDGGREAHSKVLIEGGVGLIGRPTRTRNVLSKQISDELAGRSGGLARSAQSNRLEAEPPVFSAGGSRTGLISGEFPISGDVRGVSGAGRCLRCPRSPPSVAGDRRRREPAVACDVVWCRRRDVDPRFIEVRQSIPAVGTCGGWAARGGSGRCGTRIVWRRAHRCEESTTA